MNCSTRAFPRPTSPMLRCICSLVRLHASRKKFSKTIRIGGSAVAAPARIRVTRWDLAEGRHGVAKNEAAMIVALIEAPAGHTVDRETSAAAPLDLSTRAVAVRLS